MRKSAEWSPRPGLEPGPVVHLPGSTLTVSLWPARAAAAGSRRGRGLNENRYGR